MNYEDIYLNIHKKRKILFDRKSKCLKPLINMCEGMDHKTMVMWALSCAKVTLEAFEMKYSKDLRPRICLERCEAWSRGEIKMPIAKAAILNCHALSKELDDLELAALCHAIAQAGSTLHVKEHAMGLVFYELTALVIHCEYESFSEIIAEKIEYYIQELKFWELKVPKMDRPWANFLTDAYKQKNMHKDQLIKVNKLS